MVEAMEGDVEEVFQELAMKLSTRSYNCVIQKLRCASRQTICWTIALSSTQISCRQSGGNIFYALFTDDMWANPIGTITSISSSTKQAQRKWGPVTREEMEAFIFWHPDIYGHCEAPTVGYVFEHWHLKPPGKCQHHHDTNKVHVHLVALSFDW